jgi:hypothetical protein
MLSRPATLPTCMYDHAGCPASFRGRVPCKYVRSVVPVVFCWDFQGPPCAYHMAHTHPWSLRRTPQIPHHFLNPVPSMKDPLTSIRPSRRPILLLLLLLRLLLVSDLLPNVRALTRNSAVSSRIKAIKTATSTARGTRKTRGTTRPKISPKPPATRRPLQGSLYCPQLQALAIRCPSPPSRTSHCRIHRTLPSSM